VLNQAGKNHPSSTRTYVLPLARRIMIPWISLLHLLQLFPGTDIRRLLSSCSSVSFAVGVVVGRALRRQSDVASRARGGGDTGPVGSKGGCLGRWKEGSQFRA
jgi:hypothetical protein